MSTKRLFGFGLIAVLLVLAAGLWAITDYYANLPQRISQHETIILGQNHLVPGSRAALRVVVRDSRDGSPLPGSEIKVSLQPNEGGMPVALFTGIADDQGTANVNFDVPANLISGQSLVVETVSSLGSDRITQPVAVTRDYRILLTTDKPIYQPGQTIHLRALALSTFDLVPAAGHEIQIAISDGKGNKVFGDSFTASDYGVAATDFQLADQVNTGSYKITATMGETSSEKTVTVEHYVLPKFKVAVTPDRTFYLPGERVRASLNANYFFGKPVAEGNVQIEGYTFDVARAPAFNLQGATDAEGNFHFEFDLPGYIAGSDLESGLGRFYLQVDVTDQAGHAETANLSFPVSQNQLIVEAVPESGTFRPGVENILYLLTSAPDGAPVETALALSFPQNGQTLAAQTDHYGLAEVRLTPDKSASYFFVHASAANGATAERQFFFENQQFAETVLLRPDRPIYRVGDSMTLTILTTQRNGTAYLDIVREGQTVSTRALDVKEGRAEVTVDLTPDLYGTLELHAYKILGSGDIARDTRLIVVDAASALNLSLTPDRDTYRPGDVAGLDIQVNGADGTGSQSAIGLAVVDESVFALAEQDPGFAKLYFMLEQELLEPKYELHGVGVDELISHETPGDSELRLAQEGAAQATLADAALRTSAFSLHVDSHFAAIERAGVQQRAFFNTAGQLASTPALLLPWPILILSAVAAWREKRFGSSFAVALVLLGLFICPLVVALGFMQESGLVVAGVIAVVSLIVLAAVAWSRDDPLRKWLFVLLLIYSGAISALIYVSARFNVYLDPDAGIVILLGLIGVLFALVMQFISAWIGSGPDKTASTLLIVLSITSMIVLSACGGGAPTHAPAATAAPAPTQEVSIEESAAQGSGGGAAPPRLRQYFPETMLWLPDGVTDESGYLHLDFPVADSITTWRMTALASTRDGRLGSAVGGLRVFQDFFIDLDLPVALTVGDEISLPVSVFNYLPEGQAVRLTLEQAEWFTLVDDTAEKDITIGGNDISVVYFRIRALGFGTRYLRVTAIGAQMSDAIQKSVRVFPNGKQFFITHSDRLTPGSPVARQVAFPESAIPGAKTLTVKIYPGVASQVVEGLDSILQMPNGCFEQTSSTTYPNVLVLDYLRATNQASPEVQFKAEDYINLGYQRLTTYEVPGGGFSLWGDAPADIMLTAYGLQEFTDMSRVHNVDPAFIGRAAEWLLAQQQGDGSWAGNEGFHESALTNLTDRLPVTAYVAWSLIDAGYINDSRIQAGLAYVREYQSQTNDPYVLALVANALVAADVNVGGLAPQTEAVLNRLAEMANRQGAGASWSSGTATFMGSEGQTADLETTALVAFALLRANLHSDLASAALTTLIQQKDNLGNWYTTQATVLALKAFIQSVRAGGESVNATVAVTLSDGQTRTAQITPENFDVVQLLTFDDLPPDLSTVEISASGEGNLMYQISGSYYLPWESASPATETEAVSINVAYDRAQLSVNDTVQVNVTVSLNQVNGRADSALIDLGVPPGFSVEAADLAALVARDNDPSALPSVAGEAVPPDYALPTIERYELTGRQVLVYIKNLSHGQPLNFSYRLRAKFPLIAQTPASSAYDYYNPDQSGEAAPQLLVVAP